MPKSTPLTIAELHSLLPRLAATVQLLEGLVRQYSGAKAASTLNGSPKGRGPGRKAGSRSRAGAAQLRGKLLATLKGAKGLALSQVVKRVGGSRIAVQYHLKVLRSEKKARVVGNRATARWFA